MFARALFPMVLIAVAPCRAEVSPYELGAVYTADGWRNTRGGRRIGAAYLDKLDLTLAIDGELAWQRPGLNAFVHVLRTNPARFSEPYVGDAMTVSNIDAAGATRLYEAWLEWAGDVRSAHSVRVGLYDLNSEFDASEARSLFIHSGHGVGHDLGQTGANGPSIFPVTSLAVRAAWQPTQRWRVLGAVLDAVPGRRSDPDRPGLHVSRSEGALGIVEAQWASGRISHFAVGHWRYTSKFPDLRSTADAPRPGRRGNRGSYVSVEVDLDSQRADGGATSSVFVRYGVADAYVNEFRSFLGAGMRARGVVAARAQDELGLALSWASLGTAAREAGSAAEERDPYEAALELTYRMPVREWLTLQPDIQFILNPGAERALADSLVVGLRIEISL